MVLILLSLFFIFEAEVDLIILLKASYQDKEIDNFFEEIAVHYVDRFLITMRGLFRKYGFHDTKVEQSSIKIHLEKVHSEQLKDLLGKLRDGTLQSEIFSNFQEAEFGFKYSLTPKHFTVSICTADEVLIDSSKNGKGTEV